MKCSTQNASPSIHKNGFVNITSFYINLKKVFCRHQTKLHEKNF